MFAALASVVNWIFPSEYGFALVGLVTATSVTKLAEWNVSGGLMQLWTGLVDPGSIAARAEETELFQIEGVRPGDPVWITCEDPDVMLVPVGAIGSTDSVTVYLQNNYDLTTAVDAATMRVNIQILRRTNISS